MIRLMLVLCAVMIVAGCAKPARVSQMTTGVVKPDVVAGEPDLQGALKLGSVGGGEETDPLWTSEVGTPEFRQALDQSLQASGLLAATPEEARYRVDAQMLEVDQPLFGFSLTVTSTVDYTVTDMAEGAGKVFFSKKITKSHTATVGDAFVAVERLRLANEGSIRNNIRTFIEDFIAYWNANKPSDAPEAEPSVSMLVAQ